ncbi:MAG: hypothetical protein DRN27_08200, partial [Thermoplasmata archaeon]
TNSGVAWSKRTVLAQELYHNSAISSDGSIVYVGSPHYCSKSINSGASYSHLTPSKFSYIYFLDDVFKGALSNYPNQLIDDIYKLSLATSETNGNKILISNAVSNTRSYNSLLINSNKNNRQIRNIILPFLR